MAATTLLKMEHDNGIFCLISLNSCGPNWSGFAINRVNYQTGVILGNTAPDDTINSYLSIRYTCSYYPETQALRLYSEIGNSPDILRYCILNMLIEGLGGNLTY